MSSPELAHEQPVTEDEVVAAERLAQALEGRAAAGVDEEALHTAHLLQALGLQVATVGAARSRRELVAEAARSHARTQWQRLALGAAAAVVLTVLGAALWRHAAGTSQAVLAQRELAASRAVSAVSSAWSPDSAQAARLGAAFEASWRQRVTDKLQSERAALIVAQGSTSDASSARGAGTT